MLYPVKVKPELTANTLESGRVNRYHAAPTVAPQTIAHHSWGVLIIAIYITNGELTKNLMMECAMHDTGEYFSGDAPYDAKKRHPELKRIMDEIEEGARYDHLLVDPLHLTSEEMAVLKLSDTLEGFIHTVKEERGTLIRNRWNDSFVYAMVKFGAVISVDYLSRAVALFLAHGGSTTLIVPTPDHLQHPRSHAKTT